MQILKWLGCAAVGATMFFAGGSAFAVTIGFSQVGDEGDWRPAWSKDMQEEAKKEGIDLKFADAQGKEEEQLKAVRSFIAQKVDAIIIAPVVVTGWDQVLPKRRRPASRSSWPTATSTQQINPSSSPAFRRTSISRAGLLARGSPRRARATATSSSFKAPSAPRRLSSARRGLRRSFPSSRT